MFDDPQEKDQLSFMLSSHTLSGSKAWSTSNWVADYMERGRLKFLLVSWSKKNLMEHFGFLANENNCGYEFFKASPIQQSDQKRTVFPL
jgi:hypothetical protein